MNIYEEQGYVDRNDYLFNLAEDYGISYKIVNKLASLLGESEDFDGLVSALEDMEDWDGF